MPIRVRHLLLAVLLLVAQQIWMTHAVAHLAAPAQGTLQDQQAANEHGCGQCLAFAAFGSAVPSPAFAFAVSLAENAAPGLPADGKFTPATVLHFQSRAPPRSA